MMNARSAIARHNTARHARHEEREATKGSTTTLRAAEGGMERATGMRRPAALAAILFTTVVWGLSFISTKTALVAGLTPVQIAFARFSVASALFIALRAAPFLRARERAPRGRRARPGPGASGGLRVLIGGILGVPVYFMLENSGLRLTSASTASLITGTAPVINALAVVTLLRGTVTSSQWAGIAMSCAGVYAIAHADLTSALSGQATLGNTLIFLSACAWVAYTMINKPLLSYYDNLTLNTWQTLAGTLFLLPFALHDGLPIATWSLEIWLNILYLGAICSALAYVFYLFALDQLGSTAVTSCLNLVPVFGVLGGALLLGEPLSWTKALGGALALAGAYLVTVGNGPARRS
ncbi:MAG: DMT family transporter [Betaproteobacteria bacterium]